MIELNPMSRRRRYAAWSVDEDNLLNSSSGGIFFELAKKMVNDGGYVVGVVMDGLKAKYVISNKLEEIKKMRGSKYIPSKPANIIKQIKDSKDKILFTGLPCHIEAVKKTCNTEDMVLCALVCHGLPRKNVFEEHIKKIRGERKVKSIKFRDKRKGWLKSTRLIVLFSNGEEYNRDKNEDEYLVSYIDNSIIRDSCISCNLNEKNIGDLQIGDFWGAPPSLRNENGTSIVKIVTKKGENYFNSIDTIYRKKISLFHYLNVWGIRYVGYNILRKIGLRR